MNLPTGLPTGYFTYTTGDGRIMLAQDEEVERILPRGYPKVIEYEVRSVASFPQSVNPMEIRKMARLDKRSRNLLLAPEEREAALHEMAGRFG